jgi:hypothetical protein
MVIQISDCEMGKKRSMHGVDEKMAQFYLENLKGRDNVEDKTYMGG